MSISLETYHDSYDMTHDRVSDTRDPTIFTVRYNVPTNVPIQ
jgi:hypothetical protein